MDDRDTPLQTLKDAVAAFARERDWRKYHTPKNLSASIAIEAAELMEVFQWLTPEESERVGEHRERLQATREELADVLLYALNLAGVLGIDVTAAVLEKLERNRAKYPVERYRGKWG